MSRHRATLVAAIALASLAACAGEPVPTYVSPASGAPMVVKQYVEDSHFANNSVEVEVGRFFGNCQSEFLGAVSQAEIANGFVLPIGQELVVSATFLKQGFNSSNALTEARVVTPKRGASYDLELVYNKVGYAVNVIENGTKLPFSRPCGY